MAFSDFVIDAGVTVLALGIIGTLVSSYFASGGVLEQFASNWQMVLGAIFGALGVAAIQRIRHTG